MQPFAARIGRATGGRQLVVGLGVAVAGVLLAALTAVTVEPVLGVVAAVMLGAGYGLCIVSGLTEVQRMAEPRHLAALTAVYSSATYVGFAFPVVLASLSAVAPEPLLLVLLASACAACLLAVLRALRTAGWTLRPAAEDAGTIVARVRPRDRRPGQRVERRGRAPDR